MWLDTSRSQETERESVDRCVKVGQTNSKTKLYRTEHSWFVEPGLEYK